MALLEVDELSVRFDSDEGSVHAVDRVSFSLEPGEVLAMVGESGCGKSVTAMSMLRLLPASARLSGTVRFEGRDLLTADEASLRARARARDLVRLPGADDVAEPGLHRRPPDRRGAAPPPRPRRAEAHDRTRRAARARRHPRPGAARRRVPAPALGRHAPARDDRDGGRLQPEGADRRRADDGARRDDPGGDPRPHARHPRAPRHRDPPDHARPRRRRRRRRPRDRHVRGAQGRGGRRGRAVRAPAAPVHDRAAGGAAALRAPQRRRAAAGDPRRRALARAAARRLRVRAALPARRRRVRCRCRGSTPCARSTAAACFHPGEAVWNGR